jgi:hypothetical protein
MRKGYCQKSVWNDGGWGSHQCTRRAVVDGKWCKQHDPEAEKWRCEKADRAWKHKMDNAPEARLDRVRAAVERMAGRGCPCGKEILVALKDQNDA